MRVRKKNPAISVHAIAGTHVILLGIDATEKAAEGLLGFAIERENHRTKKKSWLRNPRPFNTGDGPPKETPLSNEAPLQTFQWGDYTAQPGEEYSYTVAPVYGKPDKLKMGKGVKVTVTTESTDDQQHAVIFNRGVAGSQAYSRRFGKHKRWYQVSKMGRTFWQEFTKPETVPKNASWEWLSRGLEEAMLGFIGQAKGADYSIRASVYEFEHMPAIQAFADALERGADVKIIYDAKQSGKAKSGPWRATEASLRKVGLRKKSSIERFEKMMVPRTQATISHNKFIVLLHKGKPIQVWTGSTNYTAGGIFGQSNVGHIVRDPKVAQSYYEYWQKLATDPAKSSKKNEPETTGIRNWNVAHQPDLQGAPPPNSITTIFSPRTSTAMLEWYADRLSKAASSVHFTAAFGVSQEIAEKLVKRKRAKSGEGYQRYILLESKPSYRQSKKRKEAAEVKARPVPKDYYDFRKIKQNRIAFGDVLKTASGDDAWLQEALTGLNLFVDFLHTKYMLIDPLSDDPVVISGSANFSNASTVNNDENMLIIRGNKRVADIFLTEFMRLFNHFHVRNRINEMKPAEADASFYLAEDDSWTAPYYKSGTQEYNERLLFA